MFADASFVGTVEKDAATLAEEHKELFEAANKRELDKKVSDAAVLFFFTIFMMVLKVTLAYHHHHHHHHHHPLQKEKNKGRGKNKISSKLRRKQKNVLDAQMLKFRDKQEKDREKDKQDNSAESEAVKKDALSRFAKK